MKTFFAFLLIMLSLTFTFGQNEQSPMVEKEFTYTYWTYNNVGEEGQTNLRKITEGKKLTMVVYFAPWCPNWRHDVEFVQKLYKKYQKDGFQVIAVGEYDSVQSMKTHVTGFKLTFPVVYESDARLSRQKTPHFEYRTKAGDTRNWGSPWYVFLDADNIEKSGDVISKKAKVINGEMIKKDVEAYIRTELGLKAEVQTTSESTKLAAE